MTERPTQHVWLSSLVLFWLLFCSSVNLSHAFTFFLSLLTAISICLLLPDPESYISLKNPDYSGRVKFDSQRYHSLKVSAPLVVADLNGHRFTMPVSLFSRPHKGGGIVRGHINQGLL